jgi:hypothetical protein
MPANPFKLTELGRWLGRNSVPDELVYAKGRWDYVELLRKLSAKLSLPDVRVVGHYVIATPPPEEQLPMPAVTLGGHGATVALKWDFGAAARWPREWTLSVRRRSPYRGPTLGLFDPALDLRSAGVDGLSPEWVFGPYSENQAEFSCEVEDEWDVMTALRLLLHEA